MLCAQGHIEDLPANAAAARAASGQVWLSSITVAALALMRPGGNRSLLAACLITMSCLGSLSGCSVCRLAYRTVIREPAQYNTNADRKRSLETYRQWAEQEWRIAGSDCPDLFGQPAYAGGFVSGFVDYVRLGGTGEPPPVPPREYWNIGIRASDGKERAAQWFDGFRHGARVAMDGGYRELATLESSLLDGMHPGELSGPAMPVEGYPTSPESAAPVEDLPLPGDTGTPFQDDVPAIESPSETSSEPAKQPVLPLIGQPHDREAIDVSAGQRVSPTVRHLGLQGQLTIEDIAGHARTRALRSSPPLHRAANSMPLIESARAPSPETDVTGGAEKSTPSAATVRFVEAEGSGKRVGTRLESKAHEQ